jgi:hypothetical protein
MALTPGAKTIDYPTTASSLVQGFTVRLIGFPARLVEVEKTYRFGDLIFVRFNNGDPGEFYKRDHPFTVVSDN